MCKPGKYEQEMLPPSKDSLLHQCYTSVIFGEMHHNLFLTSQVSPNMGGYIGENDKVYVKWMTLPPAPDSILVLVNCKCAKACEKNRCSCG